VRGVDFGPQITDDQRIPYVWCFGQYINLIVHAALNGEPEVAQLIGKARKIALYLKGYPKKQQALDNGQLLVDKSKSPVRPRSAS
jgi:hypothetical protein